MWAGMARRESESSGKRSKWLSASQNRSNGGSSRGRKMHRESQSMRKGIRKDKALLRVVHTWRTAGVMGFKRNTVGALLSLRDRRFKRNSRWYPLRFAGSSTLVSPGLKNLVMRWGLSTADQNKIVGKMDGLKVAGGGQELRYMFCRIGTFGASSRNNFTCLDGGWS